MFAPVRYLADQAAAHPDRAALVAPDGAWSFRELERAASAIARKLRALGIGPRQVVAIDLPAAEDWILTLALFHIAAPSVSLGGVSDPSGISPDALLTAPGRRALDAPVVVTIDRMWIEQVVADAHWEDAADPPTVLFARHDATCRVILTSGTTGTPRAALLSVSAVEHRLENLHHYWTDERSELNMMSLSTTGGFHTALASLKHGTPYLTVDAVTARLLRAAADARIEVLAGSPVQIGHALALLTEENLTLPHVREVRTAGAAATPSLLTRVAETLAVPVRGVYGSTEGGGITSRMLHRDDDLADAGRAVPGVELQIVDDDGSPVAPGVSGEVRYRGPGLASGYGGEDLERSFRRGWFHPGDYGVLTESGSLLLEGRSSEIVNVGGVKVDPATVDAAVEGFPGVIDAGTFIIEQRPGIPELGLAVVADADCDLRALDRLLRQRLPGKHPTVFGQVSVIPRNRMGKVERARLTAEFARRLDLA